MYTGKSEDKGRDIGRAQGEQGKIGMEVSGKVLGMRAFRRGEWAAESTGAETLVQRKLNDAFTQVQRERERIRADRELLVIGSASVAMVEYHF